MRRSVSVFLVTMLAIVAQITAQAEETELTGEYLEARTCQVYTGPCFAAGEVGLAGKEAVMAWKFNEGGYAGQRLDGLCMIAIVQTDKTLGFVGIEPDSAVRARLVIDERATAKQEAAMKAFLKARNADIYEAVADVQRRPIQWQFDTSDLVCQVRAGKFVTLATRKANPDDCICSNESAYYPPLTEVEHFVPGVATEFAARGLQRSWQVADTRSAYMATFRLSTQTQIAGSAP